MLQDQLKKILLLCWEKLGKPRNIFIIDSRNGSLAGGYIYYRSWVEDGVHFSREEDRLLEDSERLFTDLNRKKIKVVFIRSSVNEVKDLILSAGDILLSSSFFCIDISPNGRRVFFQNEAIVEKDVIAQFPLRIDLNITGSNFFFTPVKIFPHTVCMSTRNASEFNSVIMIEAVGTEDLPAGEWYKCPSDYEGDLIIDIEPGLENDKWSIFMVACDERIELQRSEPPINSQRVTDIEFLSVILDRTCPDNSQWKNAFNLVYGVTSVDRSYEKDDFDVPDSEDGHSAKELSEQRKLEEFNRDIKHGLIEGLSKCLNEKLIQEVQGWWFKDTKDEELVNFVDPGIDMDVPAVSGGGPTATSGVQCSIMFQPVSYSPGLDIWDPVDEALEMSLNSFDQERIHGKNIGILIIGNSPPINPAQTNSPFNDLTSISGSRHNFYTRRQSHRWHRTLEECKRRNIPVCYLFLQHSNFSDVDQKFIDQYTNVQGKVYRALHRTVSTITAVAELSAVSEGVLLALKELKNQLNVKSGVLVHNRKEAIN